jgi:hypothetical protein
LLHTDGIDDQRRWVRNERIFFPSSLNLNYVTAGEQKWIVCILTGFGNTRAVYETSTVFIPRPVNEPNHLSLPLQNWK